jgi:hypothetical protein
MEVETNENPGQGGRAPDPRIPVIYDSLEAVSRALHEFKTEMRQRIEQLEHELQDLNSQRGDMESDDR